MNIFPLVTKLLNTHGLKTEIKNGWISLKGFQHKLTVSYEEGANNGNLLSVKLTFNIALSSFEIINESLVGLGPNLETAIENGVSYFAQNVLHVLLTGLWDYPEDEQCSLEKWDLNDSQWNATIGNISLKTNDTTANDDIQIPDNIVETIQNSLNERPLNKGRNWIRLYYSVIPDNPPIVEVLLNNQPWDDGRKSIADLGWQESNTFYSIRLFILLEKNGYEEQPINEMETVDAIYKVIKRHDHIEADSLFEELIKKGYPQTDLFTATDFIPIALGRILLSGLGIDFSPLFEKFDELGNKVETKALKDNPFFIAAQNLFWKLSKEDFQKIAFSSAEVDAVNQALNNGSNPADLAMLPPIFFTKNPTDEGMQKVQAYMQMLFQQKGISKDDHGANDFLEEENVLANVATEEDSNQTKSINKKWWEFWK